MLTIVDQAFLRQDEAKWCPLSLWAPRGHPLANTHKFTLRFGIHHQQPVSPSKITTNQTHLIMSRRIIALNNNGVHSLRCGRLHEAILSFRHAVECMKTLPDSAVLHLAGDASGPTSTSSGRSSPPPPCPLECLDQSSTIALSPHNMFDVYQSAFTLPKRTQVSSVTRMGISMVLFYNLGLAHHLAGLANPEDSCSHLMEALRFYKITVAILKTLPEDETAQPAHVPMVDSYCLMLASLTNLGHLFSHFWSMTEALNCRQAMDQLLDTPKVMTLSEADGEFFFTSVYTYETSQLGVLAPAA